MIGHVGSQAGDRGRNSQLNRFVSIVRDLDRLGGVDIYELAERYGVHVRTIRRDLAALEEAGMPIATERPSAEGRVRRRANFRAPVQDFAKLLDRNHYLALTLAMEQGGATRTMGSVYAQLEDLAEKIEKALGKADHQKLKDIAAAFHSWEKFAWRDAPPDVLWRLVEAITARSLCRVSYRAARADAKARQYTVLPLKIFAHDGAAYLLCHVPKYDSIITLNLHRLHKLETTAEKGTPPADFDAAKFENAAFGVTRGGPPQTWRLRFSAEVAPFIRERTWHPTQVLTETEGGGLELTFTCEGAVEVFAWVASWGAGVEVLTPESARRDLAGLGAWLGERYAAD
ncbi:transcriptional regulator [Deltaproteobacteria bacterium]|nr:transcriptional regulator [Deltaproteobacteria bacterium]